MLILFQVPADLLHVWVPNASLCHSHCHLLRGHHLTVLFPPLCWGMSIPHWCRLFHDMQILKLSPCLIIHLAITVKWKPCCHFFSVQKFFLLEDGNDLPHPCSFLELILCFFLWRLTGLPLVVAFLPDQRLHCGVPVWLLHPLLCVQAGDTWSSQHFPLLWLHIHHSFSFLLVDR